MKTHIYLAMALAATFCLFSCGNNTNNNKSGDAVEEEDPCAGDVDEWRSILEVGKIVITQEDNPGEEHIYEFEYGKDNRIVKMVESWASNPDEKFVTSVAYKERKGQTIVTDNAAGTQTVYTEGKDGNVTAAVSERDGEDYTITYTYEDGRLSSVTDDNPVICTSAYYTWDSDHRITNIKTLYGDGTTGIDTYSGYSSMLTATQVNILDIVMNGRLGFSSLFAGASPIFYPTLINSVGQEDGETISADWTEFSYVADENNDEYVSSIHYSYGEDWRVNVFVDITYVLL